MGNIIQAPKSTTRLCHHRLQVWHYAMELVRLVKAQPIGDRELRDQAERACRSVALNIAEGAALDGAAKRRYFKIARASGMETVAAYELAETLGEPVAVEEVTRLGIIIVSMLSGLIR
jgi:four helix bundle protein